MKTFFQSMLTNLGVAGEVIAEDKQDTVQAVCHQGTGRLQTVRREWNPLYHPPPGAPVRLSLPGACWA